MTHRLLSERAFGLTFTVIFLGISALGWWLYGAIPVWAFATAFILLLISLAAPWLLLPLNRLWGAFSRRLGRVTNFLLLGLFFFLILLPVGAVMRLVGHDPLRLRSGAGRRSHFTPVTRHADAETFSDMF